MGANESSQSVREYKSARASFSPEEVQHFDEFFTLAAEDGAHKHSPTKQHQRKFTWEQFDVNTKL